MERPVRGQIHRCGCAGDAIESSVLSRAAFRIAVEAILGVLAAALCWFDVSWALKPGLFPILDEIGTWAIVAIGRYRAFVYLWPKEYYADRPLGWAFIKAVGEAFGFHYSREVVFLIAIHFACCALAFWMFRRLGVGVPVAIGGVALFGGLWTTAQTATYLGEAFDPICLLFLLGCVIAALYGQNVVSALLYLAALRSKEFAIVAPVLLAVLFLLQLPRKRLALELMRRLWLHFAILIAFGIRYALLYREYRASSPGDSLYAMDFHVSTVVRSLSYYTSLVFGMDWMAPPVVVGAVFALALGWAVWRRRAGIAFGLTSYILFALPVLLMPRTHQGYWIYAPQVFLILAICLMAEAALAWITKSEAMRWGAAVCLVVMLMAGLAEFRRSGYFRDRVHWNWDVRSLTARTAAEADAKIPKLGKGTHVYVAAPHGVMPWLFIPGPCSYFQAVDRERWISCVMGDSEDAVRAQYLADLGPRVFVKYREDGSIGVER